MAEVFSIQIDEAAAKEAIDSAEGLEGLLKGAVTKIASAANASSVGNRTQETVRYKDEGGHWLHPPEEVGGQSPVYVSDVTEGRKGLVGIVSTGNYAARKDNLENNTIVKSLGAANG